MPVPWEALFPLGIVYFLINSIGPQNNATHKFFNNGKRERYGTEAFDDMMILRDESITGSQYVQYVRCHEMMLTLIGACVSNSLLA